jgi:hypothetical protein
LLFKGNDLHDAVEGFGESCRGLAVESLIDAGEDALVEQRFQEFLRADVELFGELANGDALSDRYCARLALDRRRKRFGVRGAAWACARTRANGMKLALALGESFFDERSAARWRRLAHVERLAGLGFSDWRATARLLTEGRSARTWRT